jgi:hypothetical protein
MRGDPPAIQIGREDRIDLRRDPRDGNTQYSRFFAASRQQKEEQESEPQAVSTICPGSRRHAVNIADVRTDLYHGENPCGCTWNRYRRDSL